MSVVNEIWTKAPAWLVVGGAIAGWLVVWVLKRLYRRDGWKTTIQITLWMLVPAGINAVWGIPGLLVTLIAGGGFLAWHATERADRADRRRRARVLRAMERFLRAKYVRYHEHLHYDESKGWRSFEDFLKSDYEVTHPFQLMEKWVDGEGFSAKEFDRMHDAEIALADREEKERANGERLPASIAATAKAGQEH